MKKIGFETWDDADAGRSGGLAGQSARRVSWVSVPNFDQSSDRMRGVLIAHFSLPMDRDSSSICDCLKTRDIPVKVAMATAAAMAAAVAV